MNQARVLFVDDEAVAQRTFARTFGRRFDVDTANSAEEGLVRLADPDFAVLVTDQRMPGMTGIDLCEKARAVRPDVFRILVTAYPDQADTVEAINRGRVHRYFLKPYDCEDLSGAIETGIENHGDLDSQLLQHELRKVLAGIESNARGIARIARERAAELTEIATDEARLVDTGRFLLERARRAEALRPDEPALADLASVAEVAVRQVRSVLEERATIVSGIEAGPPIAIPPSELGFVLTNLLANAGEAIPRGQPGNVVSLSARSADGVATIVVYDTGRGIAPEEIDRIFDRLYTTRSAEGGEGLGLWAVRRIVELRGGAIEVESEVGRGTTFTLRLPLVTD